MPEKPADNKTPEAEAIDQDMAAAIAAAVILHHSETGRLVALFEQGRHDEGFWGRASRAGIGVAHFLRRD